MITLKNVNVNELESAAQSCDFILPIEQTAVWTNYQATIEGRKPWGCFIIQQDEKPLAFISLIDFETHGYHYVRSMHGPAWLEHPTQELETQVLQALATQLKQADKNLVFMRVDTWYDNLAVPVLSTVPYNQTVIISLEGGYEEILKRMKTRGRRDVRKAMRECPATCMDETERAYADFSEYYEVMVDTGKRDGFVPAPLSDYTDMLGALGKDHCRVFAARVDERVVGWSIITIHGPVAVRYYAAMRSDAMHMFVTDRLLYAECCMLYDLGVTHYDLMGIGNDFAPSLKGLNVFKTKFSTEIIPVAAGRDIPLRPVYYKALTTAKKLRKVLKH
ncbi:MAG: GNAT family N-acetyltransferase [Atopobium sp.]|uniref:lipid II:glycine glycyltransferase FemX n=1 Tax=Atopobium sp. TaxID=1872650 RepID=UPI002A7484B8|nr:GNAT family N-acetyltransferase [Atopobium sp.]MDY2788760.1 GNAT family N-acetyltransferase [Atopobium sp.]